MYVQYILYLNLNLDELSDLQILPVYFISFSETFHISRNELS
jgi:hypothetical protein